MPIMNDEVKKYLQEKYQSQLGDINTAQAFANLGDVISGQKVGSQNQFYDTQRKTAEGQTLDRIDKYDKFKSQQAQAEAIADFRKSQLEQQKAIANMNDARMREISNENRKQRIIDSSLKLEEKKIKDAELNANQAKQLGLAEIGSKASDQYDAAIKSGLKSGEYDPTSYGDWWDSQNFTNVLKSAPAKAAKAAEDNWIESFLRDASGAAIPNDERNSYREIYFPRPGDTPEIVNNKASLRKQKEKNALIGAGPGAKQFVGGETQPSIEYKMINGKKYQKVKGGWQKVSN